MAETQSIAAAGEWDALAEVYVASSIKRYLGDNPPPDGSRLAHDLCEWAQSLERDGCARRPRKPLRRLPRALG
jgi:hypothetical protein